jgi:hypothetical protein
MLTDTRTTADGRLRISQLELVADNYSRSETRQNVVVASGGTPITYSEPFNLAPNVSLTLVGGDALTTKVLSKTNLGFTAVGFTATGSYAGAVVDWRAEGV